MCLAQSRVSHAQCSFLQPGYGGWERGIRAFHAQIKPHAFQVSSGGGNFSLSFLKLLLPPRKNCVCSITRALKGRVKTPETRPIEFCLAHKHLTQTRYIVRLFIGPKLPSLNYLQVSQYLWPLSIHYLIKISSFLFMPCAANPNNTKSCLGEKNTNIPIVIYPNPSGQDGLSKAQACNFWTYGKAWLHPTPCCITSQCNIAVFKSLGDYESCTTAQIWG